jgi:hypothetical protein
MLLNSRRPEVSMSPKIVTPNTVRFLWVNMARGRLQMPGIRLKAYLSVSHNVMYGKHVYM